MPPQKAAAAERAAKAKPTSPTRSAHGSSFGGGALTPTFSVLYSTQVSQAVACLYTGKSSISFSGYGQDPTAFVSSNKFASGSNQNAGNFITNRPSTRVHAAPGGASSIVFGGDRCEMVAVATQTACTYCRLTMFANHSCTVHPPLPAKIRDPIPTSRPSPLGATMYLSAPRRVGRTTIPARLSSSDPQTPPQPRPPAAPTVIPGTRRPFLSVRLPHTKLGKGCSFAQRFADCLCE